MDVNMVFMIPAEFHAPMEDVAKLAFGAKCAMFEKPENPGAHMKPHFIQGHLDGTPMRQMLIDGVQASTSCHCHCSRCLATSKVILNI
jgi:hypothetical protein